MNPDRRPYSDIRDLVEDSLEILAERRSSWLGDDLAAIALLASLIEEAERQLAERVDTVCGNGHCWDDIAQALGTTLAEFRMRFDGRAKPRTPRDRDRRSAPGPGGNAAPTSHRGARSNPAKKTCRRGDIRARRPQSACAASVHGSHYPAACG